MSNLCCEMMQLKHRTFRFTTNILNFPFPTVSLMYMWSSHPPPYVPHPARAAPPLLSAELLNHKKTADRKYPCGVTMVDDVTIKVMQDSPMTSDLTALLRSIDALGSGLNASPLSYLLDDSRFEAYCVHANIYISQCHHMSCSDFVVLLPRLWL
jgi:hypothetical protein